MAKTVDKLFKEAAWKEGFSLEQTVFKTLKASGWELLPNRYYFDSFLNRTREFDLLAYKYYSRKEVNVFVALVIECKFNPYKIVFYSRRSDGADYDVQSYIGDYVTDFFNSLEVAKVFKGLKKYKSIFRLEDQVFGYQAFEEVKEIKKGNGKVIEYRNFKPKPEWSDKNIFSGINTAIQATRFEQSIRDRSRNVRNVFFYFPLVVFSDSLYKADLESEKKSLVRERIIKYRAGMASKSNEAPDEFTVHICDLKGLQNLSKAVDHVSRKLTSAIDVARRKKQA